MCSYGHFCISVPLHFLPFDVLTCCNTCVCMHVCVRVKVRTSPEIAATCWRVWQVTTSCGFTSHYNYISTQGFRRALYACALDLFDLYIFFFVFSSSLVSALLHFHLSILLLYLMIFSTGCCGRRSWIVFC